MMKLSLFLLLIAIASALAVGSTAGRAQGRRCRHRAATQEEMAYMQPGGETNMERCSKPPRARKEEIEMAYMHGGNHPGYKIVLLHSHFRTQ